jgi:hypothetical protein
MVTHNGSKVNKRKKGNTSKHSLANHLKIKQACREQVGYLTLEYKGRQTLIWEKTITN